MIFILIVFLSLAGSVISCPPSERISPLCHCKEFLKTPTMTCNNVLNPDELVGPVRAAASSGSNVETLTIQNSSLLYVPSFVFKDTNIQKIYFLSTEIMSLSDSDTAFDGLENTLTEIRATDAEYIAQWDWKQLRNLKKLELIDVNWITLGSIDEPFPEMPNLKLLGIIEAKISFVIDYAFHMLPKLQILNLKGNDISEVKRNMFPDPANDLVELDFCDNELTSLPENFFTNMPSLTNVKLDKNKFATLSQKMFSFALRNLHELTMLENPFRCDCRLRWMVGVRAPYTFLAVCTSPETLRGTSLRYLDVKTLWC